MHRLPTWATSRFASKASQNWPPPKLRTSNSGTAQARSSRYQDFSTSGVISPPELTADEAAIYQRAASSLLDAYAQVRQQMAAFLERKHPCPADMKPDAYKRNLAARAFDVARYLLPFGISTGVGQVTSIRTLEKQIRRLRSSEFQELRDLAHELALACAQPPECSLSEATNSNEALAPTLARHADPDEYAIRLHAELREWSTHHLDADANLQVPPVDLHQPTDHVADICASLLYPVTHFSYRALYQATCNWAEQKRKDLFAVALGTRNRRDELPRAFRSAPYVFDIVMDIGAYRDLHRHRRCQQLRQQYTSALGFEVPAAISECGVEQIYTRALETVTEAMAKLPQPAAQYLLPLAARSRFLFKMDFAELEYISKLRSGVKGHFSYRKVAWEMKQALVQIDPMLGALVEATPPWDRRSIKEIEDRDPPICSPIRSSAALPPQTNLAPVLSRRSYARGAKPKLDDFITKVVTDPSQPQETLSLQGFLGGSSEPDHTRVYSDMMLKSYVDIANSDIIHTEPLAERRHSSSRRGNRKEWNRLV